VPLKLPPHLHKSYSMLTLDKSRRCRDRLAFGEVRGSNAALASAFRVDSFPALLVVCNGDAETREAYSGEMKSEPIRRFLDQFIGGKRCRQVRFGAVCVLGMLYLCGPSVVQQARLPSCDVGRSWPCCVRCQHSDGR
jgi:hypothetical protein